MQRYFASINKNDVILTQDDVFHLLKVMRAKINDHIEVVDENGNAYLAVINSTNPLNISIVEPILKNNELDKKVTLYFALAKSDKNEFVIQKATELGASEIILFQGERSIVRFSKEDFNKKLNRYMSITKEASEQCHREKIPAISFITSLKEINPSDLNLFAYELDAGKTSSFYNFLENEKYESVSVIIGPEGGFSIKEAESLKQIGFKNISLGKRILRCETAAVYALSVIASYLEK